MLLVIKSRSELSPCGQRAAGCADGNAAAPHGVRNNIFLVAISHATRRYSIAAAGVLLVAPTTPTSTTPFGAAQAAGLNQFLRSASRRATAGSIVQGGCCSARNGRPPVMCKLSRLAARSGRRRGPLFLGAPLRLPGASHRRVGAPLPLPLVRRIRSFGRVPLTSVARLIRALPGLFRRQASRRCFSFGRPFSFAPPFQPPFPLLAGSSLGWHPHGASAGCPSLPFAFARRYRPSCRATPEQRTRGPCGIRR